MKNNYFITIILIAIATITASAESACRVSMVINGVVQNWGYTNFTAAINLGDTLQCSVATGSPCHPCTIDSAATYWIFNGDTSHEVTFAATDTGVYTLYAQSSNNSPCPNDYNTFHLVIHYTTASVTEISSSDGISVSPTLSNGIFNIMADKKFERLVVSDCMGRIVLIKVNNISEINISQFSSGIYYYTISDETKKVWRGRVVKE